MAQLTCNMQLFTRMVSTAGVALGTVAVSDYREGETCHMLQTFEAVEQLL